MNMISSINPTSKASLKSQCLIICKGDVDEAKKLYDFYCEDMQSLPDFDPIPPTTMENVKTGALGIFNWVKENKDDIAQGIDFVRSMVSKRSGSDAASGLIQDAAKTVLPPINE